MGPATTRHPVRKAGQQAEQQRVLPVELRLGHLGTGLHHPFELPGRLLDRGQRRGFEPLLGCLADCGDVRQPLHHIRARAREPGL